MLQADHVPTTVGTGPLAEQTTNLAQSLCDNPPPTTRRSALRGAAATRAGMAVVPLPALADITQTGDAALLAMGGQVHG